MRIDDQRFDFPRQISHPFNMKDVTVSANFHPVSHHDSSWSVAAPMARVSTNH